ncbi:MAG TPA: xanthine dehydrogenase accessory protein XdhC [Stellaceae bacterium]|jgi:xanthine dehydrogenase accessory factor|nr:xanthine dehydrogenase accessory protein XdhC [Stellaceae bacterium]
MSNWLQALSTLAETGSEAVLVTVVEVRGSTPRDAGAKMVVTRDRIYDTVGGGHLELKAIELSRAMLRQLPVPQAPAIHRFPLGPSLGQCCGGEATLLLEPILPPAFHIALFGAGHVGKALVKLLGDIPCRVTWIDPRDTIFPETMPNNVSANISEDPEAEIETLPAGAFVLVMTHSHPLDQRILETALKRDDFRYIGLIGSATKRARFLSRLKARGLGETELARLTCPIGIEGAGGKHPAEIAIAVAAQLLQVRDAEAARLHPPLALLRGGAG